jgi:hypothetical protein
MLMAVGKRFFQIVLASRPCQRQEMARHFWGDAGNERSEGKGWRGASPPRRVFTRKSSKKFELSTKLSLFNKIFLVYLKIFLVFSASTALGIKGL